MNQLTIHHNHGVLVLRDVTVDGSNTVTGTVVQGHSTSRLFHHTHTTHYVPGTRKDWPLYGRTPRPDPLGAPGTYTVDCCFCG